jgi:arabinofuranan 3-O-arabinosyltransferase
LYDIDAWPAIVARLVPDGSSARYPPVYGPQISVFFSPLARLPYITAMLVWMAFTLLAYLACGHLLWSACPRLRDRRGTIALLLLAAPALHYALTFAQISAIALLCVTAAFFALRANRPLLAGIAIGSLVYKPPLGLAFAFVFVFAAEWRIVIGALIGAALQLAAAWAFWGMSVLRDYAASFARLLPAIPTEFEPFRFHMHSWMSFFDLLGLPRRVAFAAYLVAALITMAGALACWRARGPLALRYSALLIATVLVDPHMYVYDFVVLMPAFLLLTDWALAAPHRSLAEILPRLPVGALRVSLGGAVLALVYFCYFSPLFSPLAQTAGIQLSVPALSLLALVLWAFLRSQSVVPSSP